jgi:hypothetical protein
MELVGVFGAVDSEKDPAGYEALIAWMNHGAEVEPEPENVIEHDEWGPEGPAPVRPGDVW